MDGGKSKPEKFVIGMWICPLVVDSMSKKSFWHDAEPGKILWFRADLETLVQICEGKWKFNIDFFGTIVYTWVNGRDGDLKPVPSAEQNC